MKHLNLLDPRDALYAACRVFGIEKMAMRRGISPPTMYQKLDKDNDKGRICFGPELDEFIDELKAAEVPIWDAPLCALAYRHGGIFVRLPDLGPNASVTANELMQDILHMVQDQGRLATVLSEAVAGDDEIDSKEFEAFETAHASALSTLAKMGEHVRELHLRAKAAGKVR
jgi:hypothetical protein